MDKKTFVNNIKDAAKAYFFSRVEMSWDISIHTAYDDEISKLTTEDLLFILTLDKKEIIADIDRDIHQELWNEISRKISRDGIQP